MNQQTSGGSRFWPWCGPESGFAYWVCGERRCGYATAKREVDALKAAGHIEFLGPSKTGYYKLAKTASA